MSTGDPDNRCLCGLTVSGGAACPIHPQELDMPKLDSTRYFISPEQEAELRVMYRNHFKQHGVQGLFMCMGEMLASIKILNEVMVDITNEEKKKDQKDKKD